MGCNNAMETFFYRSDYDGRAERSSASPCSREELVVQIRERNADARANEQNESTRNRNKNKSEKINSTERILIIVVIVELIVHYLTR